MEAISCPSCGVAMQSLPTPLPRWECPSCGTTSISRQELENLAQGLSDHVEYDPSPEAFPHSASLHCPQCGRAMKKATLLHHNGWLLDYCPDCDVFYANKTDEAEMTGKLPNHLTGEFHLLGHDLRAERMLVSSFMDATTYLRISVNLHPPLEMGVRVYSEKWTDSLAAFFERIARLNVTTGNRKFDENFSVRGKSPERIRKELLTPTLQEAMLRFVSDYKFFDATPTLELLDDRLIVVEGPVPFDMYYDLQNDPKGTLRAFLGIADLIRLNQQPLPLQEPTV
jgi:Zn-finger nucleic acid-binding protein